MTAPAVTPRVQYTADGGLGPLVIPWPFYDDDDLLVYDGETLKIRTTEYTLTGAGEATGGTLTWVSGFQPDAAATVTIVRQQVSQRDSDLPTAGTWRASVVNTDLDYIISGLQDLLFKAGLAIRVSPVEGVGLELPGVADRANKHLAFDGTGAVSLTTDAPVSDLKRTDPPITLIDGTAAYALPAEVQSGLDEDNYQVWLVGGGLLVPGDEFTVTADTITLTTTPTSGNGLAGQELMVELVRPAINATAVQPGSVGTAALATGAVTSPKLNFPGQGYGDLLARDNTPAWVPLPAPTSDGKYLLGMDVSGGATVKAFEYKPKKANLNDWSWPALNSTPTTIINTLADNDVKMTITQGDEILTRSITIDSDTAGIVIWVNVYATCAVGQTIRIGLFRDGATDALREARWRNHPSIGLPADMRSFMYQASGITAGAVTYSVRVACTNTTGRVNEEYYANLGAPGRKGGGNVGSSMFIMELGSKT